MADTLACPAGPATASRVWAPALSPPRTLHCRGSSARVRLFVARRPSHLLPALPGGLDHESPARLRGQAEAASPMQTREAAPWQSGAPTQHAAWSGSGGEEGWPRCWALPLLQAVQMEPW